MPTVLRLGGWRVVVYPNDHAPAHIHAIGADGEAVFVLTELGLELRECVGLGRVQAARLKAMLAPHAAELLQAWEAIHGVGRG